MNILVGGPQGSGKTTQARLLAEKFDLNFVDSGSVLRGSFDTELGKKAKEYMDRGEYVPEETYLLILKEYIDTKCDKKKGFVFTGFPRTLRQIEFMEGELEMKLDKVFELVVRLEVSMERLQKRAEIEKRSDETPEAIKKRLSEHYEKTGPVLDYFRSQGIVEDVNGEGEIEDIFEDILTRI